MKRLLPLHLSLTTKAKSKRYNQVEFHMTTDALGFVEKNNHRGRSIGASVNTVLFTELNPCIHYALYVNFFCGFCLIDICTELVDFVEVWWYSPKYYAQNVQFISSPLFNYYINKCRYYLFLTTITYYYSYAFEHKKKKLYKVQNYQHYYQL